MSRKNKIVNKYEEMTSEEMKILQTLNLYL